MSFWFWMFLGFLVGSAGSTHMVNWGWKKTLKRHSIIGRYLPVDEELYQIIHKERKVR